MKPNILIIDDDINLTALLKSYFVGQGFFVKSAKNSSDGLRYLFNESFELVILDVTMPQRDGWDTLEHIRKVSSIPVIMLTSRSDEQDVLRGFLQGADDYVTKPFSFAQLAARVKAVLTRTSHKNVHSEPMVTEYGDIKVDLRTRQVMRGKDLIVLSPTEFKLLTTLMGRAGEVVPAEDIVKSVWGPQYAGEVGYVRRYIWHLRKKIERDAENPQYIHNDRGYGYRFEAK